MFYQSLILVFLLALSSQIPVAMRSRWSFGTMYFLWFIPWLYVLFEWHLCISRPPAVFTAFFSLSIATALSRVVRIRPRWFILWSACCVLLAYGISMLHFVSVYHEHQRILAQHPLIDLKSRLAYERRIPKTTDLSKHSKLNDDTAVATGTIIDGESPRFDSKLLEDQTRLLEGAVGYHQRRRLATFQALSKVHAGFVDDFIEQPALGVGRMPTLHQLREIDIEVVEESDEREQSVMIDQLAGPISEAEAASKK
jgi:hypothetical protein